MDSDHDHSSMMMDASDEIAERMLIDNVTKAAEEIDERRKSNLAQSSSNDDFKPGDHSDILAYCVIRPQSAIGELLKTLLSRVIQSSSDGKSQIVLQTLRLSEKDSNHIKQQQIEGVDNIPVLSPHSPFAYGVYDYDKNEKPGQLGAIRLTSESGSLSVTSTFDATIPCLFKDDIGSDYKTPVGLKGPAVFVDGKSFVADLIQILEITVKEGAQFCSLIIQKGGIVLLARWTKQNQTTYSSTTTVISTDHATQKMIPFSRVSSSPHDSKSSDDFDVYNRPRLDYPVCTDNSIPIQLSFKNIQEMVQVLDGTDASNDSSRQQGNGGGGSNNSNQNNGNNSSSSSGIVKSGENMVLMSTDFSFIPPLDHRDIIGWQSEEYFGVDFDVGNFDGYMMHFRFSSISTSSHSQISIPFSSTICSFCKLPKSAYNHFKMYHEFRGDDLSKCEQSLSFIDKEWTPLFTTASPGMMPSGNDLADVYKEKKRLRNSMSSFASINAENIYLWLSYEAEQSSSSLYGPTTIFEGKIKNLKSTSNNKKNAENVAGESESRSSNSAPNLSRYVVDRMALAPYLVISFIDVPLDGSHMDQSPSFDMSSGSGKGNPMLREKMRLKTVISNSLSPSSKAASIEDIYNSIVLSRENDSFRQ